MQGDPAYAPVHSLAGFPGAALGQAHLRAAPARMAADRTGEAETLKLLEASSSADVHQRCVHKMLGEEPGLQFICPNYL